MSYSLGQAAKAAGKAKSTILRAVRSGRVSAMRAEDGTYRIDPAELHRVFDAPVAAPGQSNDADQGAEPLERLQLRLELVERERERERDQMQATIDDLRTRLDRSEDRITALLADQRAPKPRRWWW